MLLDAEQSSELSNALHLGVVAIEKGAFKYPRLWSPTLLTFMSTLIWLFYAESFIYQPLKLIERESIIVLKNSQRLQKNVIFY